MEARKVNYVIVLRLGACTGASLSLSPLAKVFPREELRSPGIEILLPRNRNLIQDAGSLRSAGGGRLMEMFPSRIGGENKAAIDLDTVTAHRLQEMYET